MVQLQVVVVSKSFNSFALDGRADSFNNQINGDLALLVRVHGPYKKPG